MIRIHELRLPIDHSQDDLLNAILKRLRISHEEFITYEIFKRSYDARKNIDLSFIYTIDVQVQEPARLLQKLKADIQIKATPDTAYHFVAQAPAQLKHRPVVIGFWSLWNFCCIDFGANGF